MIVLTRITHVGRLILGLECEPAAGTVNATNHHEYSLLSDTENLLAITMTKAYQGNRGDDLERPFRQHVNESLRRDDRCEPRMACEALELRPDEYGCMISQYVQSRALTRVSTTFVRVRWRANCRTPYSLRFGRIYQIVRTRSGDHHQPDDRLSLRSCLLHLLGDNNCD